MTTARRIHLVPFDELGRFIDPERFASVLADAGEDPGVTDVLVFTHGWQTGLADASALYDGLLSQIETVGRDHPGLWPPEGRALVLGVVWPSKAWDEEATESVEGPASTLEESVYQVLSPDRSTPAGFRHDVLRVQQFLMVDELAGADREEFLGLLRRHADLPAEIEDESVFEPAAPAEALEGIWPAAFSARGVFRIFTYWQMKKRAGVIGQVGLRAVLKALRDALGDVRIHLVGHSFGCKVTLAAVAGPGTPPPGPVRTVVLLQGALSADAMAARVPGTTRPGGYRAALDAQRVDGPIVATYSQLDLANSQAYPIASRAANQVGEFEGVFDRFQAIGAVGAAGVGEGLEHRLAMREVGVPYDLGAHGVWSVDGGTGPSAFITGHGAIRSPQVGWLILSAMARR